MIANKSGTILLTGATASLRGGASFATLGRHTLLCWMSGGHASMGPAPLCFQPMQIHLHIGAAVQIIVYACRLITISVAEHAGSGIQETLVQFKEGLQQPFCESCGQFDQNSKAS